MKSLIYTFFLAFLIVLGASAQSDDFFKSSKNDDYSDRGTPDPGLVMPNLPGGGVGAYNTDQGAPLGSGLLVLTALGAGYAAFRKRK